MTNAIIFTKAFLAHRITIRFGEWLALWAAILTLAATAAFASPNPYIPQQDPQGQNIGVQTISTLTTDETCVAMYTDGLVLLSACVRM